jgi:hypothetical protein
MPFVPIVMLALFGISCLSPLLPEAPAVNKVLLKEKKKTLDQKRVSFRQKRAEKLRYVRYHQDRLITKQIEIVSANYRSNTPALVKEYVWSGFASFEPNTFHNLNVFNLYIIVPKVIDDCSVNKFFQVR